ncbi:MAG: electron transfer flavoprotein subunit alpha/FixB family protein [Syntrophorhabdaceae bacterium]|nr:electron transfer flavoprotein subunit alpha/FixB family protein [Syntrophorhabdaceae bacterium]
MSYTLIISEVRRGVFEERNLDSLGLAHMLKKPVYMLLPDGQYPVNERWSDVLIKTDIKEELFTAPKNICLLLDKVIERFSMPDVIILTHSSSGTECASYIAGYFKLPVITDVNGMDKDAKTFYKSYYSDKVYGEFAVPGQGPVVITVRSGAFRGSIEERTHASKEETIVGVFLDSDRAFIEFVEEEKTEIDITKAEFLVSVGRGVGNKDELPAYDELTGVLNATLSCSRPVVDKLWLPKARQVGQSGKTVRPKVYLAMGISGAFQHIAGMKDSECIIAVNKDPEAPIFQYAHYGIVGDMNKVRDKLKELLKG